MKKLIGIGIAAMMVVGLAGAAHASATDWVVYMKATDQSGVNALLTSNIYGWKTSGASDVKDSSDLEHGAGSGSAVVLGAYDINSGAVGNGWDKDIRPTGSTAYDSKWHLKLFLQPSCNAQQIILTSWNPTGTSTGIVAAGKKVSIMYNGAVLRTNAAGALVAKTEVGNDWIFDGTVNGTATLPAYKWIIDVNAGQYKGVENAINLQIAVPEPGSMVAMFSGLVGLVGFGIRRRK